MSAQNPVDTGDTPARIPMCSLQHAMLLHSARARGAGIYVQQLCCVLREDPDVAAMERAWEWLLARHEILRASFRFDPQQAGELRIHDAVPLAFDVLDWRGLAAGERRTRWQDLLESDSCRGFDPEHAPLIRITLVRTGERSQRMLWSSHHALFDAHARRILLRELFARYEAERAGDRFEPPPPPPYHRVARWLHQDADGVDEAFWRALLAGIDLPSPLGIDRARPRAGAGAGRRSVQLEAGLGERLRALAAASEVSLNNVVQGAWAVVLGRLGGSREAVFGVVRAGRPGAWDDAATAVGLCVNTLPLRVAFEPGERLDSWLRSLRAQWRALRAHEHAPLPLVQRAAGVPGDRPVFDTVVSFERDRLDEALRKAGGGWRRRHFVLYERPGPALVIQVRDGDRPEITVLFDRGRFDDSAIAAVCDGLRGVLGAMARGGEQVLARLWPPDAAAEQRELSAARGAVVPLPGGALVHRLFETQARRRPDAPALWREDACLTYGELNSRANRLARYLRRRGVRRDAVVAVCLERGFDQVVAFLAVIKAGGAYLPLDPQDPPARRGLLLQEAGARLVVSRQGLPAGDPGPGVSTVCPGGEGAAIERELPGDLDLRGSADDLACIMFTSGSTGRPKGVAVRHAGIVRLLCGVDYVRLDEGTCTLHLSPAAFDASTFELWGALVHGGQCVLYPGRVPSLAGLRRAIAGRAVNTLWLTATLFNTVIDELPAALAPVRQLLTGGEALSVRHVVRALECLPGIRLVNGYGPTENTTFSCCHTVTCGGLPDASSIPIGRPIANTRAYVLDRWLDVVPQGLPGELYLGGAGLARGYLGQPGLTAASFLPDPFAGEDGARMYRTGDRVRRGADGVLEFLGRVDEQVKVRGHRAEPGEIESVLEDHPDVSRAVVAASGEAADGLRLVAWIVPQPGAGFAAPALRAYLGERLPAALVPSQFVAIDAVPTTASGKIDRAALPRPAPVAVTGAAGDPELARIWREVLGADAGADADFFELGGHSLLATRLVARINVRLGVDLPVTAVFDHPSFAALAAAVSGAQRRHDAPADDAGQAGADTGAFPLSPAQRRLWLHDQFEPGSALFNIPVAFRVRGALDVRALGTALARVMERHELLRARFEAGAGGDVSQRIAPPGDPAIAIDDLRGQDPETRAALARQIAGAEARTPFDLARGPVMRARIVRLDEADQLLVLNVHHIVADGWSMNVMLRDLGIAYDAALRDASAAVLPPQPAYRDYVSRQQRVKPASLAYWREQLRDVPILQLPLDGERHARLGGAAGRSVSVLDARVTGTLAELARAEHTTLFTVLLALLGLLLARHAGQDDVVIGTPVAGRDAPELEAMVGLFLKTLALRLKLAAAADFRGLLRAARRTVNGALAHQDGSFEDLVDELRPPRAPGRNPFFDVTLNYLEDKWSSLDLSGMRTERVELEEATVKFDLTLYAARNADGMLLRLHYRRDLFTQARADGLLDQLVLLAQQVAADPDTPLARLSLVTPRARALLPDPASTLPEPAQGPVMDAIGGQAKAQPLAPAVVCGESILTYAQLWSRSGDLAAMLVADGVAPGETVAVLGQRCIGLVVAILAVLRAGGVLLVLDEALPAARRQVMAREAGARRAICVGDSVVTGDAALAASWRADAGDGAVPGGARPGAALPVVAPAAPAYVFFTSGSTGIPKGVLGSHKGLAHFVSWQRREFGVGPGDRCAQLTALSFDAMLRDVFLALTSGATVCLPGPEVDAGDRVAHWLRVSGVSILHVVPSVMRSWLACQPGPAPMPRLRWLLFTGELLTGALVQRVRDSWPGDFGVVNLYGPTETTLIRCFHRLPPQVPPGPLPVGRALPESQALVLGAGRRLCGPGECGEIYLRTPFRSLGYINDAQATRRRFLPNPCRDDPLDLVYRTGDRGRYTPDGLLEVVGRDDDQVKINGVRIEPGEIAAVLESAAEVSACAVVARGDGDTGAVRLVAYIVPRAGMAADPARLGDFLRERLPAVMVPSAWAVLEQLPRLATGKVDRDALPPPSLPERPGVAEPDPDPVQARVARAWRELLKIPRVDASDNFFFLGGHSLLAAQLVARLRAEFGVAIGLASVFEAPTLGALARRIRCAPAVGANAGAGPAEPEFRPLGPAQGRIWFTDQMAPHAAAYNIRFAYRLRGDLDLDALQWSVDTLVRRHEALRIEVHVREGTPVQRFVPAGQVHVAIERMVLSGKRADLAAALAEFSARPFDLAHAPLLRVAVVSTNPGEHVLALSLHHLVADGWSVGVLLDELMTVYGARAAGEIPELSPAPRYADFLRWQQDAQANAPARSLALAYWRRQLEGLVVTELPADRPRSRDMAFKGARLEWFVPAELAARVRALARSRGATPFMLLLAAFKVLLWRYTGHGDLVVGVPEAARGRSDFERLVGLCGNTVVIRTQLDRHASFNDLLEQVRRTVADALAHAQAPFEDVVRLVNPGRDSSRSPLFQILFQMQHGAMRPEFGLPGLTAEPVLVDNGSAKRDLSVVVQEEGDGLRVVAEYDSELYQQHTVRLLLERYQAILNYAANDPDGPVRALAMMDRQERERVIGEWSVGAAASHEDSCLHEQFGACARRWPDSTALVCAGERLAYAELDARANRLAHFLNGLGCGPESRVGVGLERSIDQVVAVLGILKAGGAYVPLDPGIPPARLAEMAQNAGLALVIAESEACGASYGAHLVSLARAAQAIDACPQHAPRVTVHPSGLAYVLFTSGSTSAPKAVAVEHRQAMNYWRAAARLLNPGHGDQVAMLQPLSVDSSVTTFWGTLLGGATLHILSREESLDARYVGKYFKRHCIDVLKIAPSHLRMLHDARRCDPPMPRRCLVLGGEEFPHHWLDGFGSHAGPCAIFNHYGPTETTVGVAAWRWPGPGANGTGSRVPLGRPLTNCRLYVLDESLEPLPAGVAGEIYIGGANVARGYLDASRTAQHFLPDPWCPEPGARMYRSGDRGRWLPDGNLEFLGRIDAELKVRGMRVDPAEIEAILRKHPVVSSAMVLGRDGPRGESRLVAYAVAGNAGEEPVESQLRAFLTARLPAYMVPEVVLLDRMPLTRHGKVDRSRLPDAPALPRAPTGPATPTERAVLDLWRTLLARADIGTLDDFFELGGHSLLGARLLSQINQHFGTSLGMRALFEAPTVLAQAALVDRETAAPQPAGAAGASPDRAVVHAPLSFGQQRLWFLDQLAPGLPSHNIGVFLRLTGRVNERALEQAVREIVRRHAVLRTTYQLVDDEPVQVVTPPGDAVPDLERIEPGGGVPGDAGQAALRAGGEFLARPFDLRRDLMLRAGLVPAGDETFLLCVVLHHIASDGWSRRILYRELCALYTAFDAGQPSPLPALELQYVDYVGWLHERTGSARLRAEMQYWQDQLARLPELELPTDRPRPAVQVFNGERYEFVLDSRLCGQIGQLARSEGATLFMVLMAAFQAVLSRRSGQRDFAVGTPIANRILPEHEAMIGFFVNTLAIRADLRGNPTFRQLLARVRETTLQAYDHRELPFERIVAGLAPVRELSRPPLVQVLLTLQNFPRADLRMPGCTVEPVLAPTRSIAFELNLIVVERDDGLLGALLYNSALFDADTAAMIGRDLVELLTAVAANPDARLRALLPPAQAVISAAPADPAPAHRLESVQAMFEQQARRTPDAVALSDGAHSLTFRQLRAAARRLARRLHGLGAGPEVSVGVHLERGLEQPLAVLGVIEAGAVCVPLDPALPALRLEHMMREAGVAVLLTRSAEFAAGPGRGIPALVMTAGTARAAGDDDGSAGPALPRPCLDHLAYILFTSGSTGRPKAVAMPHRGLANLVGWQLRASGPGPMRTLQFASAGFDVYFQELFATWCGGGELVLVEESLRGDFAQLARHIAHAGVERLFVPLVALREIAAAALAADVRTPDLREVITAGEALLATPRLREWFGRLPGCRLHNQYGPTETHVATAFALGPSPDQWPAVPPIGQAIAGMRIHLLDQDMVPVAPGVAGEIYVGGDGLARGYAGAPGLTAARFAPDPFGHGPGARLYRTGDLARLRRDGQLEFIGRTDAQVKIRGVRIEPGEIESVLMDAPAVTAAAVTVGGDHELVAHVVAGRSTDADGLRRYLADRLPPAMVPARFVFADALPLTASGKLDRRALHAPGAVRGRARSPAAPLSAQERQMVALWEEVLGARALGADDDFFAHGGHSLKAAQLIARIRRVLGVEAPLRWLFECPTPRSLACRLAQAHAQPGAFVPPAAEPAPARAPAQPALDLFAATWCEVLGCQGAGPGDDFFELGGHSLAAVRLVHRLGSALGVEVPLRLLIEHPEFAAFGRAVSALARTGRGHAPTDASAPAPATRAAPGLVAESRPLLPLVVTGRVAALDAAALGYMAAASPGQCRDGREGLMRTWLDGMPTLSTITHTPIGRVGVVRLPWLSSELYDDRAALVEAVIEALHVAAAAGARTVSLTGLIPSATDYGRAVAQAIARDARLPRVTTGHSTTAASVVLALARLLREAGRELPAQHVGFLGLGSIGMAALRLMLARLPHPARLTLCDLYSKRAGLQTLAAELRTTHGYAGELDVLHADAEVPAGFYAARVIVGATNVPDVLDVARLLPGTLLVDDSGPHCFSVPAAIARFESGGDILFTEGGVLCSRSPMQQLRYLPAAAPQAMSDEYMQNMLAYRRHNITGCVLSALLCARHPGLGPDLGEVAPAAAAAHLERLRALGFDAAAPHCGPYELAQAAIARFRARFGDRPGARK